MQVIFEPYDKVKDHIKRHKEAYIVGAVGFATIACLSMRGRYAAVRGATDESVQVHVRPLAFLSNQHNTVVTEIHRGGTGAPSYIVRCIDTGETWLSQRQAAIAHKIPGSELSAHLNGKFPEINGHQYERLGLATA
jgi:hypothetical protein